MAGDYAIGYSSAGPHEWHFVLRPDKNAVIFEDVVGVQGECPNLGLPQHHAPGILTFKYPECVVVRRELTVGDGGWITIEPYGTHEVAVCWWIVGGDGLGYVDQYTIGPTVRVGWRFTPMPNLFDPLREVSEVNSLWLKEQLAARLVSGIFAINYQALVVALAAAYAFLQMFGLLESTSKRNWERVLTLVAWTLIVAYMAYGYAESKLAATDDKWTKYVDPAGATLALAFIGSVIGHIDIKKR